MKELTERLNQEFSDIDYAHAYSNAHVSARIATQIKVLREQRGLSQSQLAELSDMKQERISKLENIDYDAWTINALRKLARAFDTTVQVSFIPFSQVIQDIADFSREHLQVDNREVDLARMLRESQNSVQNREKFDSFKGVSSSPANDDNYQDAA